MSFFPPCTFIKYPLYFLVKKTGSLDEASFSSLEFQSNLQNSPTPSDHNLTPFPSARNSFVKSSPNVLSSSSLHTNYKSSSSAKRKYISFLSATSERKTFNSRQEKVQNKRARTRKLIEDQVNHHLSSRHGMVLNSKFLLKIDTMSQFTNKAFGSTKVIQSPVSGAMNLRKVPVHNMYACAQPSIPGIRSVLNFLQQEHEDTEFLWINLREEPLCFVNGRTVVLRESEMPFKNLKYFRGMSKKRIEGIETQLKTDIFTEASINSNNLLLHKENENRRLEPIWESFKHTDVLTVKEVFFCLRMEGYKVKYKRIPTTPERPPPKNYFDLLLSHLTSNKGRKDRVVVFNCQTGRSRSTYALVTASLISFWTSNGSLKATREPQRSDSFNEESLYTQQKMEHRHTIEPSSLSRLGRKTSSSSFKSISSHAPKPKFRHVRTGSKSRSNSLLRVALKASDQDDASSTSLIDDLEENIDLPPISEISHFRFPSSQELRRSNSRSSTSQSPVHTPPKRRNSLPQISLIERKASALSTSPHALNMPRVLSGRLLSSLESELQMAPKKAPTDSFSNREKRCLQGFYPPVNALLRLLEKGKQSKQHVDFFIDDCDELVNLREIIFKYRSKALESEDERRRSYNFLRAATYLVRYVLLIIFDSYLNEQVQLNLNRRSAYENFTALGSFENEYEPDFASEEERYPQATFLRRKKQNDGLFHVSFTDWLDSRLEIKSLIQSILHAPEAAILLDLSSKQVDESLTGTSQVFEHRKGSMLNSDSILKLDHILGSEDRKKFLDVTIRGANLFRDVLGTPFFGCASPTITGARNVIQYLHALKQNKQSDVKNLKVVWINLRSEPIAYLNGKPYILRATSKPFKNLRTFSSMEPIRIEMAEQRLKNDILQEKKSFGGRILTHVEDKKNEYELEEVWEELDENEDVLTPREAFADLSLKTEGGLHVEYHRLGFAAEKPPTPENIDALFTKLPSKDVLIEGFLSDSDSRVEKLNTSLYVFTCQMGRGRSTLAMILGYLYLNVVPQFNALEVASVFKPSKYSAVQSDKKFTEHQVEADTTQIRSNKKFHFRQHKVATSSATNLVNELGPVEGRSIHENDKRRTSEPEVTSDFFVILELVRVLKNGAEAQRWADVAIRSCSEVEDIRERITHFKNKASYTRSQGKSDTYSNMALMYLKRYFMIISVASYLLSQRKSWRKSGDFSNSPVNATSVEQYQQPTRANIKRRYTYGEKEMVAFSEDQLLASPGSAFVKSDPTFHSWFTSRKELATLFNSLDDFNGLRSADGKLSSSGFLALEPVQNSSHLVPTSHLDKSTMSKGLDEAKVLNFIAERSGTVLVRGSILKHDHFPGCYRLQNPEYFMSGAPNFRPLQVSAMAQAVKVYGTGIPTVEGLDKIIGFLGIDNTKPEEYNTKKKLIWVNLREEPILYINGHPFVVRKLEHPFENLEYTGIATKRVEGMEQRLKRDVISELDASFKGSLVLHGEDDLGLKPYYEDVKSDWEEKVQTPKELYQTLSQTKNLEIMYFRIPITDEQAPKLSDFNKIFKIASQLPVDDELVLHCQMGRGRTTTGVILVVMTRLWKQGLLSKTPDLVSTDPQFLNATKAKIRDPSVVLSEEEFESRAGDIRAITKLITILPMGGEAKVITDYVIDVCDEVQNLREAIWELKASLQAMGSKVEPAKRASLSNRATQYIQRYAKLIIFCSYLLCNKTAVDTLTPMESFTSFVQERKEIHSIIKKLNFIL
eukprot:snap_masked-scaffold_14-processed-gene-10.35-mRNA-1 protein AED:1.00 eAED:1.00 QI:0/0/0/0/1/1/3/0/1737